MIELRAYCFVFLAAVVWLLTACTSSTRDDPSMGGMERGMMERHMAAIPPEYAGLENAVPANAASLARGQELYEANCATCHGDEGRGNGPAAAGLDPQPAPIAQTAPMLSDAYLFYRISEGGALAPFNSAMPTFENLDENERWDVINYIRSLDGGMMDGGMMGGNMLMMVISVLLFIGFVVIIVLAVLWVIRRRRGRDQAAESPLEILKRRYARGEIDAEQYETIKGELEEE